MKKTIRIAMFGYDPDPDTGVSKEAFRGDVVDLGKEDVERGIEIGAFVEDFSTPDPEAEGVDLVIDFETASVGEIEEWIREDRPTVAETVEIADGSPAIAEKVLEAETSAYSGEPRKGVVDGLSAILGASG